MILCAGLACAGCATSPTGHVFVAVNLTGQEATVYHPEINQRLPLPPKNGYQFLHFRNVPERLIFFNKEGRIVWQPVPDREKMYNKKVFLGREVDLKFNFTGQ
ncbi:MAG: hypothetical protein WC745_00155 [Patescibacteria group bacterium]